MGEATLEQALRTLGRALVADLPVAEIVRRVADLAGHLEVPAAAVEVRLVDGRGRSAEEARVGVPPIGLTDGPEDCIEVKLEAGGVTLGALTLHAEAPGGFTDDHTRAVEVFAEQAATLLANARAYWDLHEVATGLQSAMQSRAVIEQAKGKLMAHAGCTADEAFTMLARASQRDNVKLRELARRIVVEDARLS